MFRIYKETANDFAEVEYLYDIAFAPGRTALSSYRLRADVEPVAALCLIARDDFDAVSGAIRYWPIRIGPADHAALLLGPVAVHPTRQGEGLGAILLNESLRRAFDLGWTRIVLIGDAPYYSRFGFRRDLARAIDYPPPYNPDRLLARALVPGAFRGVSGMVHNWNTRMARAAAG